MLLNLPEVTAASKVYYEPTINKVLKGYDNIVGKSRYIPNVMRPINRSANMTMAIVSRTSQQRSTQLTLLLK